MSKTGKLKRVRIASRKDPLIDPSNLKSVGIKASKSAKTKAFSRGVSITTVRNGAIVKVDPNGRVEEIKKMDKKPFPKLEDDLCLG